MAQRKPYNPNTKYGRRKMREQYYERRANMTSDEKFENDSMSCLFAVVILVVIGGLIFLVGGSDALLQWLK